MGAHHRRAGLSLMATALLLAGCLAPAQTLDPGPAPPPARPERPANPSYGHAPSLLPDSDFVEQPWGYVRKDWQPPAEPVPAVFMMDGYTGASEPHPTHYIRMRDGMLVAMDVISDHPLLPKGYVLGWASIRGTGCSAGTFDLFDQAHAMDGYELIEWLAAQSWTTGKVGLFGASYSGITAFLVASTEPPHLVAMSANMVIADLYRDIAYPGGVPNIAFPVEWSVVARPYEDYTGMLGGLQARDEICAQNLLNRPPAYPADNPLLALLTRTVDDPEYHSRSLLTFADHIKVPTFISHAWQDEQTGPRGGVMMFNAIHPDPVQVHGKWVEPKMLVATNGKHMTAAAVGITAAKDWFDYFLQGIDNGVLEQPPVKLLFGTKRDGFTYTSDGNLTLPAFPAPDTNWTRAYFRASGALSTEPPAAGEGSDAYLGGSPRQSWGDQDPTAGGQLTNAAGPDVLTYRGAPAEQPWLLAGPMTAELWASITATDTDFFVSVADVAPDGAQTFLARGMLRASHRALDMDRTEFDAQGDIVRPYHPHTDPQQVPPNTPLRYDIEVFPLAHIFYPGHQLQVRVHTPPLYDGLWGYNPLRVPSVNTILHDAEHASGLLVPIVPWEGPLPPEPPCGGPDGYRCVTPVADATGEPEPAVPSGAPASPGLPILG